MKYIYQRDGAPLIRWQGRNSAPMQTRAADSVALGSLEGSTLDEPTLVLPAPGAPEPLNGCQGSCSCKGSCGGGMGGAADILPIATSFVQTYPLLSLGGAYLAYRLFFKKKR